jgi:hypothetical protein
MHPCVCDRLILYIKVKIKIIGSITYYKKRSVNEKTIFSFCMCNDAHIW